MTSTNKIKIAFESLKRADDIAATKIEILEHKISSLQDEIEILKNINSTNFKTDIPGHLEHENSLHMCKQFEHINASLNARFLNSKQ